MMTKGYITIATGKEEYYRLAGNLLRSYRHFCKEPLPFAILCDRENEYTAAFDKVILFPNGATNSYLDKLSLGDFAPYEETMFIDADCLAYGDLNSLFDCFTDADDMSCFGRVLPLEDKTGWFEYENLGELKSKVSYVIGLHGGIYFMRKTARMEKVFRDARSLVSNYADYHFKGKFQTPGDEPLVALSMAVNACRPVPFRAGAICCYWEHENRMKLDITHGIARCQDQPDVKILLMHWGTRFTRTLLYQREVELLEIAADAAPAAEAIILDRKKWYQSQMRKASRAALQKRITNKLKRMLHIHHDNKN